MSGTKPIPNSVLGVTLAKKKVPSDPAERFLYNIESMSPCLEGFLKEYEQSPPAIPKPLTSAVRPGSKHHSNSGEGSNDNCSGDGESGEEDEGSSNEASSEESSNDEGTPLANRLSIPSSEDEVLEPHLSGAKHSPLAVPGVAYHVKSVKGNEYMSGTKILSPATFTPSHRSFPSSTSPGSSTGATEPSQPGTTRDPSHQTPHYSDSRAMSSDEITSPVSGINTTGPSQTGTARNPSTPTPHREVASSMLPDSNTSPATAPPPTTPQHGRPDSVLGTPNTTPIPCSIFRNMLSGAIPSPAPPPLPNPTPPIPPSARFTDTQRSFIATLAWQGKTAQVIHDAFNTQFPADARTLRSIQGERTKAKNRTGLYKSVQALPGMEDDGEQAQRAKRVMDARDRHRDNRENFNDLWSGKRTLLPESSIKQEDSTEGVAPEESPLANRGRTEVDVLGMGSSTPRRALPPGVGQFQGLMQQLGEESREIKQENASESNQETGKGEMEVDRKEE